MRRQLAERLKLLDQILLSAPKKHRESVFLAKARAGNVLAQYACGVYYLSRKKTDCGLYWLCVAELNGFEDATIDMNQMVADSRDGDALKDKVAVYRALAKENPVRKETMDDIVRWMSGDEPEPDLVAQ